MYVSITIIRRELTDYSLTDVDQAIRGVTGFQQTLNPFQPTVDHGINIIRHEFHGIIRHLSSRGKLIVCPFACTVNTETKVSKVSDLLQNRYMETYWVEELII